MKLYQKIITELKANKEENYTADVELKLLKQAKGLKSAMQLYKVLTAIDCEYMVNNPESARSCKHAIKECIDALELSIALRDGKDTSKWMC